MKPFPWKCGHCRDRAVNPTTLAVYETEMEHDGRRYPVKVTNFEVFQCGNCQTVILDDAANRVLSAALREAAELMSPEEIRAKRLGLNLTQKDLANYLRISESTISRWESGAQIQQRGFDVLLSGFFAVEDFRRHLGVPEPFYVDFGLSVLSHQPIEQDFETQASPTHWLAELGSFSGHAAAETECGMIA
jgi:transcriptional regulator with XRE-family HTH domain